MSFFDDLLARPPFEGMREQLDKGLPQSGLEQLAIASGGIGQALAGNAPKSWQYLLGQKGIETAQSSLAARAAENMQKSGKSAKQRYLDKLAEAIKDPDNPLAKATVKGKKVSLKSTGDPSDTLKAIEALKITAGSEEGGVFGADAVAAPSSTGNTSCYTNSQGKQVCPWNVGG